MFFSVVICFLSLCIQIQHEKLMALASGISLSPSLSPLAVYFGAWCSHGFSLSVSMSLIILWHDIPLRALNLLLLRKPTLPHTNTFIYLNYVCIFPECWNMTVVLAFTFNLCVCAHRAEWWRHWIVLGFDVCRALDVNLTVIDKTQNVTRHAAQKRTRLGINSHCNDAFSGLNTLFQCEVHHTSPSSTIFQT